MKRSSLILVLSLTLMFGAIGPRSSRVHSATERNTQSQNADPPQSVKNDNSSKAAAATAPAVAERSNNPGSNSKPVRGKARPASSSRGLTRVQMKNVDFHVDDVIVLHIRDLRGALLRKSKATPPVFDDKRSFTLRIDSGNVGIDTNTLTELMNNYVFAYPDAPLKEFSISTEGNQIKMTGKMHKVVWLPFEIVGDLSATPEGKIQLHPTSIKTEGIPVKGLMNLFGLELDDLIKPSEERGVKMDDNDIIMDPELILPPPEIRGRIIAVWVEGDEVIQAFGAANNSSGGSISRPTPSRRRGANYMYYWGGTIRFGKLTMTNADLKIVDRDSKNPFDFSIDHYNRQLIAGYSKTTPKLGLVVYMPDYNKLQSRAPKRDPRSAASGGLSKQ